MYFILTLVSFSETKIWDEISTTGEIRPIQHSGHGASIMENGNSMIVYGTGYTGLILGNSSLYSQVWKLDLNDYSWSLLPNNNNGPNKPLAHYSMAKMDENRFWIIGGITMNNKAPVWENNEIWEYNLSSCTWKQLELVGAPSGLVAAFTVNVDGKIHVVSGENGVRKCTNDIWMLHEN